LTAVAKKVYGKTMNEPSDTIHPLDNDPNKPSGLPLLIGIVLTCLGLWMLFDSVRVTSGYGWFSGYMRGWWTTTTSTGIVFIPFVIGVVCIFYNMKTKWPYWLTGIGITVVLVEMLSRIRFVFNMKTSHLLLMLALVAAGLGFCLQGYFRHAHSVKKEQ
jgi:uncharacterized protein